MKTEWLAQHAGEWYSWKPLSGLDPSLSNSAMWIGAAIFAKEKAAGKPEAYCQMEAEKSAFRFYYRVRYSSELKIIMNR
jgi:hypothetical protein